MIFRVRGRRVTLVPECNWRPDNAKNTGLCVTQNLALAFAAQLDPLQGDLVAGIARLDIVELGIGEAAGARSLRPRCRLRAPAKIRYFQQMVGWPFRPVGVAALKSANQLIDEIVNYVKPPEPLAIVILERTPKGDSKFNWTVGAPAMVDEAAARFAHKVSELRRTDPQIDWSAVHKSAHDKHKHVVKRLADVEAA